MSSNESLLQSLEEIKTTVCGVESKTAEFGESLLAFFLNGTDIEFGVEGEMIKLSEAIRQLWEIIQTIEAKIRQHEIIKEDYLQVFVKLESDFSENEADEYITSELTSHSLEVMESEGCDLNEMSIVKTECKDTDSLQLSNSSFFNANKEAGAEASTGCVNSRLRKKGTKKKKSRPVCKSRDTAQMETLESWCTSNDIKLKQEVKISLVRLSEDSLPPSDANFFTNSLTQISKKRAAAEKALKRIKKRNSIDRESSTSKEWEYSNNAEDCEGTSNNSDAESSESDTEKVLKNNTQFSRPVSQNRRSKSIQITAKSVKNKSPSPCPNCGVKFLARYMKIHIKQHDDPNIFNFVCSVCSTRFISERHFKIHQQSHSAAFGCPECDKVCSSQSKLDGHIKEKHSSKQTASDCRWCLKEITFTSSRSMIIHETQCLRVLGNLENSTEGPWKCPKEECSNQTSFSNFNKFRSHMKNGIHPYVTEKPCLAQGDQDRSEVVSKRISCPKCKESHGSKSFLNHIKYCLCAGPQGTIIKCPLCNLEFSSIRCLWEHLQRHQRKDESNPNSSMFRCPKCDLEFSNERNLNRHLWVIHSTDRPFLCNKCPATFKWKLALTKHLRVMHPSVENPRTKVICDQCGHTFAEKQLLDRHIKQVHLDLRPFSCTLCEKKFKAKNHLNYHLKTHDNPKTKKRSVNKPRLVPVYRTPSASHLRNKFVGAKIAKIPIPPDETNCKAAPPNPNP